jgi:hypothetical protein
MFVFKRSFQFKHYKYGYLCSKKHTCKCITTCPEVSYKIHRIPHSIDKVFNTRKKGNGTMPDNTELSYFGTHGQIFLCLCQHKDKQ